MFNRIRNLLLSILFFLSIIFVLNFYFSEKNVISTNKIRSHYLNNFNTNLTELPILKNDTGNIIVYRDDLEDFNKKRKIRFFEKLFTN